MANKVYLALSVDLCYFDDNHLAEFSITPRAFYLNDGLTLGFGGKSGNTYFSKERVVIYSHKMPEYSNGGNRLKIIKADPKSFSTTDCTSKKPKHALYIPPDVAREHTIITDMIHELVDERDKYTWSLAHTGLTRTVIVDAPEAVRELGMKIFSGRKEAQRSLDRLLIDKDVAKFARAVSR